MKVMRLAGLEASASDDLIGSPGAVDDDRGAARQAERGVLVGGDPTLNLEAHV
jgi:hypothetical protein